MINITLKQLRYLEAVVRHGHFGRAAAASAISQPALSMQIKEQEQELGSELIERGTRQVRLTGFGEGFMARVRDTLRSVDELVELARASKDRLGRLRIGIIPTIAPYLLPAIIGNLKRQYDGIEISVRETLTSNLVEELLDGRLDTAIVADLKPDSPPVMARVLGLLAPRPFSGSLEGRVSGPCEALPDFRPALAEISGVKAHPGGLPGSHS